MEKRFRKKQITRKKASFLVIAGMMVCASVSVQAKSLSGTGPVLYRSGAVSDQGFPATGEQKRGLVMENGIPYVYDTEGNLVRGGFIEIDGKKYRVSEDGIALAGWYSLVDIYYREYLFYFDPETYEAATGMTEIEGRTYLFGEDGVMIRKNRDDGKKYWFQWDGALQSGWVEANDWVFVWQMYYDPETYEAATGLTVIDRTPYVFDENGVLIKNQTPVIDGKKYYVNGSGVALSGWLRLADWQMYYDPETYAAATGLTKIGGNAYLFDENGVEILKSRTEVIDGKKYWFQPDGSLLSGWCKLGVWTMYFDPETYEAAIGQVVIDGTEYLFDENGVLQGQRPA